MLIPAAGALVFDARKRLLMVRRGRPPQVGAWTIPGGKCLADESPSEAVVRETEEETGLRVRVVRHVGRIRRQAPSAPGAQTAWFVIDDFLCERVAEPFVAGKLVAGDDAAEVRWCTRSEFDSLPLVDQLAETLEQWHMLPSD